MRRLLLITSLSCVMGGCATAKEPAPVNVDAVAGLELYVIDGREVSRADVEKLPRDRIERIEVIKGKAAIAYGADARGGVIMVTTKRPR
jgi:outer membrane receptor protein involved in Fe transport